MFVINNLKLDDPVLPNWLVLTCGSASRIRVSGDDTRVAETAKVQTVAVVVIL